uniref:Cytochrome P450 monooxygenase verB n=1 Tax=Clonostachys rogersoniana TaxID=122658 RepID=VERB_CLORO|nr:RecName: Full=Cytochrome P450 monooxygenase verB; AltName: Full=Verticillin biosynthesis cluster protein B [Clonostachys rogersoniana]AQZ42168.1 putative cytochrome P450 [Gliocladium sp.]
MARPWLSASVLITAVILLVDYLNYYRLRKRLGGIPVVGDASYFWRRIRWTESDTNFQKVIQHGYDTFSKKAKPFAFWGQHEDFILVLPPGSCEEVKHLGPEKLNFLQAVEDSYHFKLHTNILGRSHVDAVRQSVNKNMNQLHEIVVKKAEETIPKLFDDIAASNEPFAAFLTIWHLVHIVSASYLVGTEFCANEEYLQAIEYYCINVPNFIYGYFWVPVPLRRLYWYLSPQGYKVRACKAKLKTFIVPKIRETISAWQNGQKSSSYTLLGAMLDLKAQKGQIKRDPTAMTKAELERQIDIFSDEMIFTGFDSAGPVACMVTQLLFEALRDKDLTKALRQELKSALEANNGQWNVQAMNLTPKLDSFTRESLRVNGPTLLSVTRTVMEPMQLKSGLSLQSGSIISSPSWLIHNDEDNYENAHQFDPYRFYNPSTNAVTTKVTTASTNFLGYGYGTQMCPGRHLGIKMSQILFSKLLMRYDGEFADAKAGKPANIVTSGQVLPPYYAKVILKRRGI